MPYEDEIRSVEGPRSYRCHGLHVVGAAPKEPPLSRIPIRLRTGTRNAGWRLRHHQTGRFIQADIRLFPSLVSCMALSGSISHSHLW